MVMNDYEEAMRIDNICPKHNKPVDIYIEFPPSKDGFNEAMNERLLFCSVDKTDCSYVFNIITQELYDRHDYFASINIFTGKRY